MNPAPLSFRPLTPAVPAPATPQTLPIHLADRGPYRVLYAPGYLALVDSAHFDDAHRSLVADASPRPPALETLRNHALRALSAWSARAHRPFEPVCLTLYLNNECSLACEYCFAAAHPTPQPRLSADCVRAAAPRVAANCRRRGLPLTAVFHGGGEPTHHPAHLARLLEVVNAAAVHAAVPAFRYLATHGVIPAQRARWLARNFDLIGLSCDGPPDLQHASRPSRNGNPTSEAVERTADILHASGRPLHVRVTLTPLTVAHQPAIADYLCRRLAPSEIHVEPVYPRGCAATTHTTTHRDLDAFTECYLEARRVARHHGVRWTTSAVRFDEIHGPHCHLWRDVLQLVPGDAATACFAVSRHPAPETASLCLGQPRDDGWSPDDSHVERLRSDLLREPARCAACLLRFHCTRGCPGACPLANTANSLSIPCKLNQSLAASLLSEQADSLRARRPDASIVGEAVRHE